MYLPAGIASCSPHIAQWTGDSGRRYDFVVARPGAMWADDPAVYILAKRHGGRDTALYVGHTNSVHARFGMPHARCPEDWSRAQAMGMTHVHLRFEACADDVRRVEVRDLVSALRPPLNESIAERDRDAVSVQPLLADALLARDASQPAALEVAPLSAGAPEMPPTQATEASLDAVCRVSEDEFHAGETDTPAEEHGPLPGASLRADHDGAGEEAVGTEVASTFVTTQQPRAAVGGGRTGRFGVLHRVFERVTGMRLRMGSSASTPTETSRLHQALAALDTIHFMDVQLRPVSPPLSPFASVAPEAMPIAGASGSFDDIDAAAPEAGTVDEAPAPADKASEPNGPPLEAMALSNCSAVGDDAAPSGSIEAERAVDDVPAAVPDARAPLPAEDPNAARQEVRRRLGLPAEAPVLLFAGEISHFSGADILIDALITVCAGDPNLHFVFAGDGAMRGDLEARIGYAGLGGRGRFLGDVAEADFPSLLDAIDFVAIPSRVAAGDGVACHAIAAGRPVVATHQARIACLQHGYNGLVTYDNPGSFVWGIRELLGPLYGDLRRHLAEAA